jgi:hypothetical protein
VNDVTIILKSAGTDEVVEEITTDFNVDELKLLSSFSDFVERIRASTFLTIGIPAISNIRWNEKEGLRFDCSPYEDSHMFELLHVLRPLILEKESASFSSILALLSKKFPSKNFKNHVRRIREVFEKGEYEAYFQISVGSQPLFDESTFKLWLNSQQYHTDKEKNIAWKRLEESLQSENARGYLITQIQGKVKAIFNLQYIVLMILRKCNKSLDSAT